MPRSNPLETACDLIRSSYPHPVETAVILGSGLGDCVDTFLPNARRIPYQDIPSFPRTSVVGHVGNLCLGEVRPGHHAALMQGRVHYYEGHAISQVVFPVRLLRLLGAKILIVTNAAGGINPQFKAGDMMLITDHINMTGTNPLIGPNEEQFGPRFPDMSEVYTHPLRQLAHESANRLSVPLQEGIYCGVTGPAYETPAEVRMYRTLGADAVGMSTVPEVIVAAHAGMQVLGISCITNAASGIEQGHHLSHQEVLDAANQAKSRFSRLLSDILSHLGNA